MKIFAETETRIIQCLRNISAVFFYSQNKVFNIVIISSIRISFQKNGGRKIIKNHVTSLQPMTLFLVAHSLLGITKILKHKRNSYNNIQVLQKLYILLNLKHKFLALGMNEAYAVCRMVEIHF